MEKEILEKWDNTCIKVLSVEHGKEVIEFWESLGVNTVGWVGDQVYYFYGIFDGRFNNWSDERHLKNKRILTLEEAIAIRDKDIKTFPRDMYVWDDHIESARKVNVVYIAQNHVMNFNVMSYDQNCWWSYQNAMEIEEYEALTKKQNENDELIKQIEKTEKELAELKSKLK